MPDHVLLLSTLQSNIVMDGLPPTLNRQWPLNQTQRKIWPSIAAVTCPSPKMVHACALDVERAALPE